jgi:hypothetical protein
MSKNILNVTNLFLIKQVKTKNNSNCMMLYLAKQNLIDDVQLFENTPQVKLNILNENIYINAFTFLLIDTVVSPIASYSLQNNTIRS